MTTRCPGQDPLCSCHSSDVGRMALTGIETKLREPGDLPQLTQLAGGTGWQLDSPWQSGKSTGIGAYYTLDNKLPTKQVDD